MNSARFARLSYWAVGYGAAMIALLAVLALTDPRGSGIDGLVLFAIVMMAAINAIGYLLLVVLPAYIVLEHWPHSTRASVYSRLFSLGTFIPATWFLAVSRAKLELAVALAAVIIFWVFLYRARRRSNGGWAGAARRSLDRRL